MIQYCFVVFVVVVAVVFLGGEGGGEIGLLSKGMRDKIKVRGG